MDTQPGCAGGLGLNQSPLHGPSLLWHTCLCAQTTHLSEYSRLELSGGNTVSLCELVKR